MVREGNLIDERGNSPQSLFLIRATVNVDSGAENRVWTFLKEDQSQIISWFNKETKNTLGPEFESRVELTRGSINILVDILRYGPPIIGWLSWIGGIAGGISVIVNSFRWFLGQRIMQGTGVACSIDITVWAESEIIFDLQPGLRTREKRIDYYRLTIIGLMVVGTILLGIIANFLLQL